MGYIEKDFLTEQERVEVLSSMLSIAIHVLKYHPEIAQDVDELIDSDDVVKLSGLEEKVVLAALDNLDDEGSVVIEDRITWDT